MNRVEDTPDGLEVVLVLLGDLAEIVSALVPVERTDLAEKLAGALFKASDALNRRAFMIERPH